MLIDISYFTKGPRHIQNATESKMPTMESQSVNNAIQAYSEFYIEPFLNNMLGAELAAKAMTRLIEIEDGAVNTEPIDVLISKLKESYADFVFFQIIKNVNTQPTMTGTVKLKSANEYTDPKAVLVDTWNRMVENNELFVEWVFRDECPYKVKVRKSMLTTINVLNI